MLRQVAAGRHEVPSTTPDGVKLFNGVRDEVDHVGVQDHVVENLAVASQVQESCMGHPSRAGGDESSTISWEDARLRPVRLRPIRVFST